MKTDTSAPREESEAMGGQRAAGTRDDASQPIEVNTRSRCVLQALGLALGLLWWTVESRWGLQVPLRRRRANDLVRPIQSLPEELGGLFGRRAPAILTEVSRRWPAFSSWTPEFLATAFGPREVEVNTAAAGHQDFLQSFFDRSGAAGRWAASARRVTGSWNRGGHRHRDAPQLATLCNGQSGWKSSA